MEVTVFITTTTIALILLLPFNKICFNNKQFIFELFQLFTHK